MLEGADKCTENHSQTMDSFSQGSSKPQRNYMSFKMKNPKHSLILFLFYCTEAKLSKHCEEKKKSWSSFIFISRMQLETRELSTGNGNRADTRVFSLVVIFLLLSSAHFKYRICISNRHKASQI